MNNQDILCIDFESQDPYVRKDKGPGWVFAYHNPDLLEPFKVLGCAILEPGKDAYYETNMEIVLNLVQKYGQILCHNALYDFGVLTYLKKKYNHNIDLDKVYIHDTLLLYKIFDNTLTKKGGYGLDNLSKMFLGKPKGYNILTDIVKKFDLYPHTKVELKEKNKWEKDNPDVPFTRKEIPEKKLLEFAYKNFDLLHELDLQSVAKYAILDIEETKELFEKVRNHIPTHLQDHCSDLIHVLTDYRKRGLRIDIEKAKQFSSSLEQEIIQDYSELTGNTVSLDQMKLINSNKQLSEMFADKRIDIPVNDEGNPTFRKKFLRASKNKELGLIAKIRQNMKLKSSFVDKLIDYQKEIGNTNEKVGNIYPEITPFAAVTSRFTSSNPNIQQQIPAVRELFIPNNPGEKFFSLDFSNQEGRLQLHYAKLLNCPGVDEFIEDFRKDPDFDTHWKIAKLMDLTCATGKTLYAAKPHIKTCSICASGRKLAKTIYLGVGYGMGKFKMSIELGKTMEETEHYRNLFFNACPFLRPLMKKCENAYRKNGYIKTFKGQKLKLEDFEINGVTVTPYYKALNLLIQGTAAEQCREVMILAYKAGIPVLACIHDELIMSGYREQAEKLKEIMENAFELVIPSYTSIDEGDNWLQVS